MVKEPIKIKHNRGASILKEIVYKKPSDKWRPTKRFWSQSKISLETGNVIDKYIVAENKEQEEEWEKNVSTQVDFFWKKIWGDEYIWFLRNIDYLIDKHGSEWFEKWWNKTIKKN